MRDALGQSLPQVVDLTVGLVQRTRRVDHDVRNGQARVVGHLRRETRHGILLRHPSKLDEPADTGGGRSVGDHDELPRILAARFDQQRHVVDDDGVGVCGEGVREPLRGLGTHRRVNDRVQSRHSVMVTEDASPERRALQRAVCRDDVVAEFRGDGVEDRRSGPLDVAHDGVGIDDDGSVRGEASGDRGLARGYSPGQSDERHA